MLLQISNVTVFWLSILYGLIKLTGLVEEERLIPTSGSILRRAD